MSTPTSHNVDPPRDDEAADADTPPSEAFRAAMAQMGELKEYAAQYIAAKADLARLSLRKVMILAMLGILGMFAGAAAIITLVVQVLSGLSQLIASLLGDRAWAGNLIVGGGLLLVLAAVCWLSMHHLSGVWRDSTVKRYERRHAQQRARFDGHDVRRRSGEYASHLDD